jgi:hypothetical protein
VRKHAVGGHEAAQEDASMLFNMRLVNSMGAKGLTVEGGWCR